MRFTRVCFARPRRALPKVTSADFAPASEYSLSTALHQRASENTSTRKKQPTANSLQKISNGHVNIVSPELCQDVLQLISPSLEKYRGCELYDINPVAGLWSKYLCKHLQPSKYHVIQTETEAEYYKSWTEIIQQKQQNATSSLYDPETKQQSSGKPLSRLSKLVNLPEVELLRSIWGKSEAKTVVVTANYGAMQRSPSHDPNNRIHVPSRTMIRTLAGAIRKDPEAFRGKNVRFLVWVNEEDVPLFLPRSLYWRRLLALELEHDYHINQLVTSAQSAPIADRPPWMTAQSAVWVAQRMLESGQVHLEGRQDPLHREIMAQLKLAPSSDTTGSTPKPQLQQDLDDFVRILQQTFRGEVSYTDTHSMDPKTRKRTAISSEWQHVRDILSNLSKLSLQEYHAFKDKTDRHRDSLAFLELHELELAIEAGKSCNEDTFELEAKASRILDIIKAKNEQVGFTRKAFWEGKHGRADNHLALFRPEPLFEWDRRPFEPLHARLEEFWPRLPLALLDFELKDGVLEKPNPYLSPFIRAILMHRQTTVTRTLDNIVLGAADSLLPNCPSITSPSHGGTFHPEWMSPLLLTNEMLSELQAAWDEYPFKLSDQTLRMMDSSDVALGLMEPDGQESEDSLGDDFTKI